MKITEQQYSGDLDKALSTSIGSSFEMESLELGLIERKPVTPGLLTALLGGSTNEVFLETNTIKYDELTETVQLPGGKTFEGFGPELKKDKARQMIYEIGSFGLRYNVAPKDYANKRKPGTNEMMDEAYVVSQMLAKADRAWALHKELAFATLLTTDQNYIAGGPMPQYNFYSDIYGTSRPAAEDMNLDGSIDHFDREGEIWDMLSERLEKANTGMTSAIVVCGKNYFAARREIEAREGLGRDLRGPLDLASMGVPRSNFGEGVFPHQYFRSETNGFTYIRYPANIASGLIGDNDAYVIPVGADNLFKTVYAPAQDRDNVNTMAQSMYAWTTVDRRSGVHTVTESNHLIMNVTPNLIIPLTFTPA